ncbi:histidine phosphatase family protein [Halopseudomonas pelagia]|uniref:Histidine phosphatase n=1 Tax=Halopseudomonas pelagia TaxID=553151 RepID=A0AA91Z540_9GAMM|nr:histidine phosphatase family protein [Halopseudomonas pelagia]PCC98597.1 histidine phosphatase [Halopseudomonas pelagia]QFY55559.1 histidine phosphatase family protein [Halopseudomonas pelagia]
MSEIYFVRHGQASFGSSNYDQLSELGHQQARLLGEYFLRRDMQFDRILTGDMVRHRETAEGICQGLGQPASGFEVFTELNEFDFHSILQAYLAQFPDQALPEKPAVADFFKRLKKAIVLWSQGGLQGQLPETWQTFEQRLLDVRQHIMAQYKGQRVLAVSSGGAIAMLVRQLLQAPSETMVELNLQTRNTALIHCVFNQHNMRLSSFNSVPHLDSAELQALITYT